MLGLLTLANACTSLSPSKERASDVYVTVIRWFVDQSDAEPPMKVFVEPLGEGSSINVDVQAEVITAVEPDATVRFIDARDEALDDTGDGTFVVRDDGLLLAFGPVPNDAADLSLQVDQYLSDTLVRTHHFELSRVNGDWQVNDHTMVDEVITVDEP